MGRLVRSQKKGKKSIYNSRFLKKRFKLSGYTMDLQNSVIVDLVKMPLTKGVVLKVKDPASSKFYHLVAPLNAKVSEKLNESTVIIKPLKEFTPGETVCNVEIRKDTSKFLCRAPGTFAKLTSLENGKAVLSIKDRTLTLKDDLKAMKGRINNGDHWMKPLLKAGNAYKIFKSRGKKYPTVSASKMNVQDHKLGGSYRKRRGIPTCCRRTRPPGAKFGHIAPSRTGKR